MRWTLCVDPRLAYQAPYEVDALGVVKKDDVTLAVFVVRLDEDDPAEGEFCWVTPCCRDSTDLRRCESCYQAVTAPGPDGWVRSTDNARFLHDLEGFLIYHGVPVLDAVLGASQLKTDLAALSMEQVSLGQKWESRVWSPLQA